MRTLIVHILSMIPLNAAAVMCDSPLCLVRSACSLYVQLEQLAPHTACYRPRFITPITTEVISSKRDCCVLTY